MPHEEMNFDSIFAFGKHKGKSLERVLDEDPKYLAWMVENEVREFNPHVMDLLSERKII